MSFVHYIQVRHFPCPSISGLAIWSVIFQVRHFQGLPIGPLFSRSVNFRLCYLVRHFLGPSFSGLAIWSVIFLSCYFRSCIFSYPSSCNCVIISSHRYLLPLPFLSDGHFGFPTKGHVGFFSAMSQLKSQ